MPMKKLCPKILISITPHQKRPYQPVEEAPSQNLFDTSGERLRGRLYLGEVL